MDPGYKYPVFFCGPSTNRDQRALTSVNVGATELALVATTGLQVWHVTELVQCICKRLASAPDPIVESFKSTWVDLGLWSWVHFLPSHWDG